MIEKESIKRLAEEKHKEALVGIEEDVLNVEEELDKNKRIEMADRVRKNFGSRIIDFLRGPEGDAQFRAAYNEGKYKKEIARAIKEFLIERYEVLNTEGLIESNATHIISEIASDPELVSTTEKNVVSITYEALTPEEIASLPEKVRDELKSFFELHNFLVGYDAAKPDEVDAIKDLIEESFGKVSKVEITKLILRLDLTFKGLGGVDKDRLIKFLNGLIEKTKTILGLTKTTISSVVPSEKAPALGPSGYTDPEHLTYAEILTLGVGENLLKLFLDYMGTITREGKYKAAALTNVDYNSLDKDQKSTYDAFSDYWKKVIARKNELLSGPLSDQERNKLTLWYSKIDDLIQNSANSWEYAFANMKNNFGLAHNVETVKIKVNPERWRRIFLDENGSTGHNGYGLIGGSERMKGLGIESKSTHRETVGPFWDMWDIAIQVAISPESGTNDGSFKYGDNLANRMGKFYDYVIDKYFWEDPGTNTVETARGKAYKKYFRENHGPVAGDMVGGKSVETPLWNAVMLQMKLMFDIGNLLDDIHATQAIRGGSSAHEMTKISVNGESKALWQVIYPIHSAGYQVENEQSSVSHTSMNIAVANHESLVDEFSKAGRKLQRGSEEMVMHTRMFVDTLIDVNEGSTESKPYNPPLLGSFDQPRGFPNFARSILEFGLSQSDRYFLVDLQGWDYMWTELFKPLGALSKGEAEQKLAAWAKMGIGRMKLVNGAISIENYVALTKLYYSRVFAAYVGNTEIPQGRRIIAENGASFIGNVNNDVQDLRFSVVRSIQERGSTINYIKPDTPMGTTRLKRALMNLLGAEFIQSETDFVLSFETYKKKQSEFAEKKKSKKSKEAELSKATDGSKISTLNSEINKLNIEIQELERYFNTIDPTDGHTLPKGLETTRDRIKGIAPIYLVRTFRRGSINAYAEELAKHEKYPSGILPAYNRMKRKMKGIFGEDALIEEIEPPYLQIQKDKEEKGK